MKPRPPIVASGLSLLLSAGSALLWVRSFSRIVEIGLATPYHWISLLSGRGNLRLIDLFLDYPGISQLPDQPPRQPEPGWHLSHRCQSDVEALYGMKIYDAEAPRFWRWLPVSFERGHPSETNSDSPPYTDGWQLTVPYWLILLIGVVWPGRQMLAIMADRRRVRRGLCRRCGYDLRGSPDRCSECGTPVPSSSKSI